MEEDSQQQSTSEQLRVMLIGLTGRVLSVEDMRTALGLKSSTYYHQVKEDQLLSLENLRALARNLDVNIVYLLVVSDLIGHEEVREYCAVYGEAGAPTPLAPRRLGDVTNPPSRPPDL